MLKNNESFEFLKMFENKISEVVEGIYHWIGKVLFMRTFSKSYTFSKIYPSPVAMVAAAVFSLVYSFSDCKCSLLKRNVTFKIKHFTTNLSILPFHMWQWTKKFIWWGVYLWLMTFLSIWIKALKHQWKA